MDLRSIERTPRGVLCRLSGVVLALVCIIIGIRPVYADPHAVFYTTVGQQQLFFNVLAALDQADYVETEEQRKQLVAQRQAAAPGAETPEGVSVPPFSAESYPAITATEAEGFSSILTRLTTLEGNDVYTDFLVRMFALEASRRNSLAEVIADYYCKEAFGLDEHCAEPRIDDDLNDDLIRREEAFTVDPNSIWASGLPFVRGAEGVLNSGEEYDEAYRADIVLDQFRLKPTMPRAPYVYDGYVADATNLAAEHLAVGNVAPTIFLENAKAAAEAALQPPRVVPGALAGVVYDPNNGTFDIDFNGPGMTGVWPPPDDVPVSDQLAIVLGHMAALATLPDQLFGAALDGAAQIASYQSVAHMDGSRADVDLLAQSSVTGGFGDIQARIKAPAPVKKAAYEAALMSLAEAESNLQFVPPIAERTPGKVELVRRGVSVSPPPGCGNTIIDPGEQCEPPNKINFDACGGAFCQDNCLCELEESPPPLCGNGVIDLGEQCEPPNKINFDACGQAAFCQDNCQCGSAILLRAPLPSVSNAPTSKQGAVAGLIFDFISPIAHVLKTTYSAGANPAGVHHEQEFQHLLVAGSLRPGTGGCNCEMPEIVGAFGANILGSISP